MPVHDWTRTYPGAFHSFHLGWICRTSDALNRLLPQSHYALVERQGTGFGPDFDSPDLRLDPDAIIDEDEDNDLPCMDAPKSLFCSHAEIEFYRRKKSSIAIRKAKDDSLVAVFDILEPGNKSNRVAFYDYVTKACRYLERGVHLLLVDVFPPGTNDPNGLHDAIWQQLAAEPYAPLLEAPLTAVAYERDLPTAAYLETFQVGSALPEMPLFLAPHHYVSLPLEKLYQSAYDVLPWQVREEVE